ncbi:MAG: GTPase HflX [Bifidobacteriaceae bacterium]|nr:GTPase HflX [Bifidobacteriaceae bacterium]
MGANEDEVDVESILASFAGTALGQDQDVDSAELAERAAVGRTARISTERADVSEVEYRQLRLEQVILVGLWGSQTSLEQAQVSLRELAALAQTAGSQVLEAVVQRRDKPDPATYLGSGKATEVGGLVAALGADTVIVDGELAPSQRRALEDAVDAKVVDRTAVILDIFAQHAQSREGKAQVELAQLEYLLPRLRGWGESMSRQAGGRVAGGAGIGSRGPGETKIELDRRRIRTRIARLRRELAQMAPARVTRRAKRRRSAVPSVVIVGYTNAGKSTLLNRLSGADVLVGNALFATLDPTVRRAETPDGRAYTLTDTVGFVRDLPHELVEAFRSTLEEVGQADLVLHLVDASHDDPEGQIRAVREVVAGIDQADQIPELLVAGKVDAAEPDALAGLMARHPAAVAVSARTGEGMDDLAARIAEALPRPEVEVDVVVPFDRGDLVNLVHEHGEVLEQDYLAAGTHLVAKVDPALAAQLTQAASQA